MDHLQTNNPPVVIVGPLLRQLLFGMTSFGLLGPLRWVLHLSTLRTSVCQYMHNAVLTSLTLLGHTDYLT